MPKIAKFAASVDTEERAHTESPNLDLHYIMCSTLQIVIMMIASMKHSFEILQM